MSINPVLFQNEISKIPDIQKDYRFVQEKLGVKCPKCANETDAPWWSGNIGKEVADKDYLCVQALLSMAALNGPTNVDEFFSAIRQIKAKKLDKMPDGYNPKEAQHPFSFFRGTVLHEYLNPNSEKCVDKKWATKIIENDISLRSTEFGKWIFDKLGIKVTKTIKSSVKNLTHSEKNPFYVPAQVFKSKNLFGDLTARALTRTPKYGVYALTGLGALHAAHEIADGENIFKEIVKTAIQVSATLAGVGYLGAIGYKHLGTLGSLVGIGVGTIIGNKIPELIFE
ncbi:MAG: hypothetical protein E7Z92_07775 [Cyanobacteria bacterium SIG31]|nr:hypothetical protein [Cyanobacteria bacterium SIG31]